MLPADCVLSIADHFTSETPPEDAVVRLLATDAGLLTRAGTLRTRRV